MPELVHDTATVFAREIAPELRSPASIVFAMGQPLLFLILFGSMLAGARADFTDGDVWQWFVPGILVMMCLLGPLSAGHGMLREIEGGQLERFLATPVARLSLVLGRTAKDTVILFVQAIVLTSTAVALGLRPNLPGVLSTVVLLTVLAVGLSSLSYVLALVSRPSGNLFWVVTQMLMFPVMLLSGILLPVDAGPGWLRVVAAINPVTYVVDAARALFVGDFLAASVLHGSIAVAATAAVGLVLARRAMTRGI